MHRHHVGLYVADFDPGLRAARRPPTRSVRSPDAQQQSLMPSQQAAGGLPSPETRVARRLPRADRVRIAPGLRSTLRRCAAALVEHVSAMHVRIEDRRVGFDSRWRTSPHRRHRRKHQISLRSHALDVNPKLRSATGAVKAVLSGILSRSARPRASSLRPPRRNCERVSRRPTARARRRLPVGRGD